MLPPGTNASLLFPGMGNSTFRVNATTGDASDLPMAGGLGGFNMDFNSNLMDPGSIFDPNMDINGTGFTGASGFSRGELPFGWGSF